MEADADAEEEVLPKLRDDDNTRRNDTGAETTITNEQDDGRGETSPAHLA